MKKNRSRKEAHDRLQYSARDRTGLYFVNRKTVLTCVAGIDIAPFHPALHPHQLYITDRNFQKTGSYASEEAGEDAEATQAVPPQT
jgi:hypothetical protein